MDCPSVECHENLADVRETVFKDKEGGCKFDIKKINTSKLSKKAIIVSLIILTPFLIAFATLTLSAWSGQKEKVVENRQRTVRLEDKYDNIQNTIKTIQSQQSTNTTAIIKAIERLRIKNDEAFLEYNGTSDLGNTDSR